MIHSPGYHSYGGLAYQPEGEPYAQIQHVLLGVTAWSVGFQDFLKALLAALMGNYRRMLSEGRSATRWSARPATWPTE